jgi:hypothetical protein
MVAPRPLDRKVGSIPSKTQWELHLSVTHQRCIHSIPNLESFTPPSLPSTSCLHACKNSRNCFCCGIGRRHTLKGGVGRKKKLLLLPEEFLFLPIQLQRERERERETMFLCLSASGLPPCLPEYKRVAINFLGIFALCISCPKWCELYLIV